MNKLVQLGNLLRTQRHQLGLSLRELANRAGVAPSYLSFLERGRNPSTNRPSRPSVDILRRLAQELEIDANILLALADHPLVTAPSVRKTSERTSQPAGATPFGVPEDLLRLTHIVRDPVAGDIRLTELEREIINSRTFQRLSRLKQQPNAQLAFPGATHTRFSHALGTLAVANRMVAHLRDRANAQRSLLDVRPKTTTTSNLPDEEALILLRIAALVHDLGHLPFEHDDPLSARPLRERRWLSVTELFREDLSDVLPPKAAEGIMRCLQGILERSPHQAPAQPSTGRSSVIADLVSGPLSACLIDGIQRDAYFSGFTVPTNVDQILSALDVHAADDDEASRLVLDVRSGTSSLNLTSALLDLLQGYLSIVQRVRQHRTSMAADAMIGRAIRFRLEAPEGAALARDPVTDISLRRPSEDFHEHERRNKELLGDDALIRLLVEPTNDSRNSRFAAQLARGVLSRRLYELVWRDSSGALTKRTSVAALEAVEKEINDALGPNDCPRVIIWVPPLDRRSLLDVIIRDDDDSMLPWSALQFVGVPTEVIAAQIDSLRSACLFADPDVADQARDLAERLMRKL